MMISYPSNFLQILISDKKNHRLLNIKRDPESSQRFKWSLYSCCNNKQKKTKKITPAVKAIT